MKNCFKSFVLFIAMICFQTYAQKDEFELPCDTLTSQTEMNICTGYKSRMIDSLINLKYNCFRTILEKDYNQSLMEKNTEMINYNKNLIEALDMSQKKLSSAI